MLRSVVLGSRMQLCLDQKVLGSIDSNEACLEVRGLIDGLIDGAAQSGPGGLSEIGLGSVFD